MAIADRTRPQPRPEPRVSRSYAAPSAADQRLRLDPGRVPAQPRVKERIRPQLAVAVWELNLSLTSSDALRDDPRAAPS